MYVNVFMNETNHHSSMILEFYKILPKDVPFRRVLTYCQSCEDKKKKRGNAGKTGNSHFLRGEILELFTTVLSGEH